MRWGFLLLAFIFAMPARPCALLANLAIYQQALTAITERRFAELAELCRPAQFSEEQKAVLFRLLQRTGAIPEAVVADFLRLEDLSRFAVASAPEPVLPPIVEDADIRFTLAKLEATNHPDAYIDRGHRFQLRDERQKLEILIILTSRNHWPLLGGPHSVEPDSDLPRDQVQRLVANLINLESFWESSDYFMEVLTPWIYLLPVGQRKFYLIELVRKSIVQRGWRTPLIFHPEITLRAFGLYEADLAQVLIETIRTLPSEKLGEAEWESREEFFGAWAAHYRINIQPYLRDINIALREAGATGVRLYLPRPPMA